jgi:hypothetical protein
VRVLPVAVGGGEARRDDVLVDWNGAHKRPPCCRSWTPPSYHACPPAMNAKPLSLIPHRRKVNVHCGLMLTHVISDPGQSALGAAVVVFFLAWASCGGAGGQGATAATCTIAGRRGDAMCGSKSTCYPSCNGGTFGGYECRPAGTALEGSSCGVTGETCGRGMICISYTSTVAACRVLCLSNGDCPRGYQCEKSVRCGDKVAGAGYCVAECPDILAAGSATCRAGFKCGDICETSRQIPATCDAVAGPIRTGACNLSSDCDVGFVCQGNSCVQACHSDADCTEGGACIGEITCGNLIVSGVHYCRRLGG